MKKVILDQFDIKCVVDGEIHSGGLGPCIAVGVYYKTLRKAWMIHHPNMATDKPLEEFLKKATDGITKKDSFKIYVTGCSIDGINSEEDNKCQRARLYVEDFLAKNYRYEDVIISWGEDGETTELIIDTNIDEVIKETGRQSIILNKDATPPTALYYDSNGIPIV